MRHNVEDIDDLFADDDFWLNASESSLDSIWNNSEDNIYGELLHTKHALVKFQPIEGNGN